MPGFTRYECPLRTCEWHHNEPFPTDILAITLHPDAATLAECNGEYMTAAGLMTARAERQRVEGIIRAHVETHSVEEWMREVQTLRGELAEARAAVAPQGI